MAYVLNNIATADGYTAATTIDVIAALGKYAVQDQLDPQLCVRANIDVANAAIFWQIRLGLEPFSRAEVFMPPGSRSISRAGISGIRARSGALGVPARVTIELVPAEEAL